MAVQKNRKTRSKRDTRRSHDSLTGASLAEDPVSGEMHLRHHITADGYYRGKLLVDKAKKVEVPETDLNEVPVTE